MTFTEHHVNSSLGKLKLKATDTGHIVANFGYLTAKLTRAEAESLHIALNCMFSQIDQSVLEQLEKAK